MSSTGIRPLWHGRALALVGIVLFAFSLRSAVASLSPLLSIIREDFAVSAIVIGLIGTAPPACYAIFGLLTPRLERRLGLERLAVIAMGVVVAGTFVRAFAVDGWTLLATTALIFAAIGVGNILLPPLVKRYFPDRVGLVTTMYSTTMAISTLLPPLLAIPVADSAGWRVSLGMWAVFALFAMAPWMTLLVHSRRNGADDIERASGAVFGRMWRTRMAVALLVIFIVSGALAYTFFTWMPQLLMDQAGVSAALAALMLSLFAATALPVSLVVPLLIARFHVTRILLWMTLALTLTGLGGLTFAAAAAPWLWVLILGLSAAFFPMSLVLIGLRARTHEGAVALSGFVQSIGYGIAAMFPFGFGLLHDLTHAWTAPLIMMAVLALAVIPAGTVAARRETVEDEWERRYGAWNDER